MDGTGTRLHEGVQRRSSAPQAAQAPAPAPREECRAGTPSLPATQTCTARQLCEDVHAFIQTAQAGAAKRRSLSAGKPRTRKLCERCTPLKAELASLLLLSPSLGSNHCARAAREHGFPCLSVISDRAPSPNGRRRAHAVAGAACRCWTKEGAPPMHRIPRILFGAAALPFNPNHRTDRPAGHRHSSRNFAGRRPLTRPPKPRERRRLSHQSPAPRAAQLKRPRPNRRRRRHRRRPLRSPSSRQRLPAASRRAQQPQRRRNRIMLPRLRPTACSAGWEEEAALLRTPLRQRRLLQPLRRQRVPRQRARRGSGRCRPRHGTQPSATAAT